MRRTSYKEYDYAFGQRMLTLRTGIGLTQAGLAEVLGVSRNAIGSWEGGQSYPKAEHLKHFIILGLQQGVFAAGREEEEIHTLWRAAHQKVLLDEQWLHEVLQQYALPLATHSIETSDVSQRVSTAPVSQSPRVDWGDALDVPSFYVRESELALLSGWLVQERCRVVSVLGMGGIGKSALVTRVMHQVVEQFEVVIWRSLRDRPSCAVLIESCLQVLAPQVLAEASTSFEKRLSLLMEQLRMQRVLLVLDNLEVLLAEGSGTGHMRVGFDEYTRMLQQIGETAHQSCLLLTSREMPVALVPLEGRRSPVRTLRLVGLEAQAGAELLEEKDVNSPLHERVQLAEVYQGNPLALKIVAQTIVELFGGEIAPFLQQGEVIFGGVRQLLDEQFTRLSPLEQTVLFWLAILREPASLPDLLSILSIPRPVAQLLEAVEGLRRRSLIEQGQRAGSFTLQSVVLEYATARLIEEASREIEQGQFHRLIEHGLCLAQAKEYVRQTQEQLLVAPLLTLLQSTSGGDAKTEARLLDLLDGLRSRGQGAQGYGPANLVTLLRVLRGHLRSLDLSRLVLRDVFLQGVDMQDASLRSAFIQASTFTETFDSVISIAVSSDGAYWAAGTYTGEVRVFLRESNTLLFVLAHDGAYSIAFSPAGQLATAGRDLVKIWSLEDGHLLATLHGHSGFLLSVAFSPDGRQLVTGSVDGTVHIWNLASFQRLHILHAHEQGVGAVAWSPDGQMIASAGYDGIRLWNAHSGRSFYTLEDIGNAVFTCAFSPDSQFLVSGGTDHLVKVWHIPSETLLHVLEGHTSTVLAVAWSPDGRLLASGSADATIRIWKANSATQQVLLEHIDSVRSVAFTVDSSRLFSGSADRSVRLWEIASGYCVRLMQGYFLSCYTVAWHPHENIIASGTSDGRIMLWNPTDKKPRQVLQGHTQTVYSVTWSPDGQMLASGSHDQTIRLWKIKTGECFAVLHGHANPVRTVAWSPNERLLASGSQYDGSMRVWDIEKKQSLWMREGHKDTVDVVAWSPDGAYVVSGDEDSTMRLWQGEDGTLLKTFQMPQKSVNGVIGVAWSPDGNLLACCSGAEVLVWDVASGTLLHRLSGSISIFAVAWSATAERLLLGDRDGAVSWWDTKSWTCLTIRKEHKWRVSSISISPNGYTVASADYNGTIIIWDMEQAVPLNTLRPDRPYERLNITGIRGLSEAQKASLLALGAFEETSTTFLT